MTCKDKGQLIWLATSRISYISNVLGQFLKKSQLNADSPLKDELTSETY